MEQFTAPGLKTPYYLVDDSLLIQNLEILKDVSEKAGCKILLAQKAFSMFDTYPLLRQYLAGTTASGLYEARLGHEKFGGETHVFSPAYRSEEFDEILRYADDIVFNSPAQIRKFGEKAKAAGKSIGLRINPECSTQEGHAIYDPCAVGSRLGIRREQLPEKLPDEVEGLHFHTLCEQNADDLVTTFRAFEEKFSSYFSHLKWLNLGGGHHITRADYQVDVLIGLVKEIRKKYGLEVYLEPGEAIALNAGYLVTEVMDIVENGMEILILDASAACHMPDVLEMPYRPPLRGGYEAGEKPFTYRLSSMTCLAGDVIGDYSFEQPVKVGDRLVFEDMAIYSMVKNNTFNGIPLPSILLLRENGELETVREFGYEDFKGRLS